jgi:hypothetical protein
MKGWSVRLAATEASIETASDGAVHLDSFDGTVCADHMDSIHEHGDGSHATGSYRTLCAEAAAGGHVVKLCRFGDEAWGLELLLAPTAVVTHWRAGGFAFCDLDDLDLHAGHLLDWLRAHERAHGERDRTG